MNSSLRLRLLLSVGFIAAVVAAAYFLRTPAAPDRPVQHTPIRPLVLALADFAGTYGSYPNADTGRLLLEKEQGKAVISADNPLTQLVAAGLLTREELARALAQDGKATGDWLYCGDGAKTPDAPLLIGPETAGRQLTVMTDGSCQIHSAAEVAKLLQTVTGPVRRISASQP